MTISVASRLRFAIAAATSLLLGSAGAVAIATPAAAATYEVDTTSDNPADGDTLREAIALANGNAGPDLITFDPALTGGALVIDSVLIITQELTITGLGSGNLSIERSGTNAGSDFFAFQPTAVGQDLEITGIEISGDSTKYGSGVVVNDNVAMPGNVVIDDVYFTGLVNSVIGGPAIIVDDMAGTLEISNSQFVGNEGDDEGGAISAVDVGTGIIISDSEFILNEGTNGGGAIYVNSPTASVEVNNSEFVQNDSSNGSGGGLWIERATTVVFSDLYFDSNTAQFAGGGAYVRTVSSLTVSNTTFFLNRTFGNRGGGLTVGNVSGLTTIDNVIFSFNFAEVAGGALATIDDPDMVIQNSRFTNNGSDGDGGAIYLGPFNGSLSVERSTFSLNEAIGYGGGLYVDALGTAGEVTVHSSTFTGNAASLAGYAVAIADIDGEATIINSTVDEVADEYGVLATVLDGEFRIRYSTILSAILIEENENIVEIVSSILSAAAGTAAVEVDGITAIPANVSYSLLSSALNPAWVNDLGGNQFSVADMKLGPLQDNGGPTDTRMPLAGSPAIDKGLPGGTPPTFDQRFTGFPRVLGGRVDAGSVETPAVLAATGDEFNIWIPIVGGVLLLGGVAAVVVSAIRRRSNG